MTIALVLAILLVAGVLFCFERIPVDVVALGIMATLLVARILTPAQVFQGLASEPVIVIGGLFIMTAGLRASGAMDQLARAVERLGRVVRRAWWRCCSWW